MIIESILDFISMVIDKFFWFLVRDAVKNVLADFFSVKGGGGDPPFPLRVFWQNDFPLRG